MKRKGILKDKLFHYEATPPDHMWPEIITTFYRSQPAVLKPRLYHYEENAPAYIWKDIAQQLAASPELFSRPKRKPYIWLIKCIAAAILILLAAAAIFYFNKNEELPKADAAPAILHPHSNAPAATPESNTGQMLNTTESHAAKRK